MTNNEKLALLIEELELEEAQINEKTVLAELEEWNSTAMLILIALMDDEFSKELTGDQVRGFVTVKDILDFME